LPRASARPRHRRLHERHDRELQVGNIIHKHNLCDPTVAWAEISAMLFENNPRIAGRFFNRPLGVLKAGAYAT
jgi:hypothetical protein